MSRFWKIVLAIMLAFVIVAYVDATRGVPFLAICSIPMGVPWAICFRKQVEQLKPSLVSLFVLVAMQAALVWYATLMNPGWFTGR